eukprot:scaffold47495_cov281-Isochrysis_galbana.AAC.3
MHHTYGYGGGISQHCRFTLIGCSTWAMHAVSPKASQPACEDVGSPAGPTLTGLPSTSTKTTKNRNAQTDRHGVMSAPPPQQPASPACRPASAVGPPRSASFVLKSRDMLDSPEQRQGVSAAVRRRPLTASSSRMFHSPTSKARRALPCQPQQPLASPWSLVDLPESLPSPNPANARPATAGALQRAASTATLRCVRERLVSSFPTTYGSSEPILAGDSSDHRGSRDGWGPGPPPPLVLRACFGSMQARPRGAESPSEGGAPPRRQAIAGLGRSASQPVVRTARSPPARVAKRPSAREALSVVASGVALTPADTRRVALTPTTPYGHLAAGPSSTDQDGEVQAAPLSPRPATCDAPVPGEAGGMPMAVRTPTVGRSLRLRLQTRGPRGELIARPSRVPLNTPFAAYVQPRAVQGVVALGSADRGGSGPPPLSPERACPAHINLLLGLRQEWLAEARTVSRSAVAPWHATESPSCAEGVLNSAPRTLRSSGFQPWTALSNLPRDRTSLAQAFAVRRVEISDISDMWRHFPALRTQCLGCMDTGSM